MQQPERQVATVGLVMVVVGVLALRRTGGKPLKVLGLTVLSVKAAVWVVSVGAALVVFALMLSNPEEN